MGFLQSRINQKNSLRRQKFIFVRIKTFLNSKNKMNLIEKMSVIGIVRYGNGNGNENNCVFLARNRKGTDLSEAKVYFEIGGGISYMTLPRASLAQEGRELTAGGGTIILPQPDALLLYEITEKQYSRIMGRGGERAEYKRLLTAAAEAGFRASGKKWRHKPC